MAKSRYITSIDQTSGLPPAAVNALNANFWNLLDMFRDDGVVIVSSVNAPDPRTDETIWYKSDTGALSIWSSDGEGGWGWSELATVALSGSYNDLEDGLSAGNALEITEGNVINVLELTAAETAALLTDD